MLFCSFCHDAAHLVVSCSMPTSSCDTEVKGRTVQDEENQINVKCCYCPFIFSFDRAERLPHAYTNGTQWIVSGILPLCKFKGCSTLSNENNWTILRCSCALSHNDATYQTKHCNKI